jgi:hypothetical protein
MSRQLAGGTGRRVCVSAFLDLPLFGDFLLQVILNAAEGNHGQLVQAGIDLVKLLLGFKQRGLVFAGRNFHKIAGYEDLWVLAGALGRSEKSVTRKEKFA